MDLSDYKDLLQDKKSFVQVAIVKKNGSPHVTPLWFNVSNENLKKGIFNINTATGRVKSHNLEIGSKIALSIQDPDNSYKYIGFHGTVKEMIQGQEADDHTDALAKKYLDHESYQWHKPNEKRIKIIITLDKKYGN